MRKHSGCGSVGLDEDCFISDSSELNFGKSKTASKDYMKAEDYQPAQVVTKPLERVFSVRALAEAPIFLGTRTCTRRGAALTAALWSNGCFHRHSCELRSLRQPTVRVAVASYHTAQPPHSWEKNKNPEAEQLRGLWFYMLFLVSMIRSLPRLLWAG